jgi:hypothetical protein
MASITDWKVGDVITASHLQEVVSAYKPLSQINGATGVLVSQTASATNISLSQDFFVAEAWIGLVSNAGPRSAADYTDNRYWVKKAYVAKEVEDGHDELEFEVLPPAKNPFTELDVEPAAWTVTNLAEPGTHALPTNETRPVNVFALRGRQEKNPSMHLVMVEPADSVIVTITGNASGGGGGLYTGTIQVPPTTSLDDDGANLAMPEGMAAGASVLIANLEESGLPTNWLKAATYNHGRPIGVATQTTPDQTVIATTGGYYRTASPAVLDAGDGKEWRRDEATAGDVYGDTPVEGYVVFTDSGGNSPAVRKVSVDAGGKWWKIGDEVAGLTTTGDGPTVTQDGGDVIFVWDNVTVTYPNTTVTGTGTDMDPYVVGAIGDLDILVKITQNGTVTVFSGDARGRLFTVDWALGEDNPTTAEANQWSAPSNTTPYRFGATYAGGDVNIGGGGFGEGSIDAYLKSGTGNVTVVASAGSGAWTPACYMHLRLSLGPVKPIASPDYTI